MPRAARCLLVLVLTCLGCHSSGAWFAIPECHEVRAAGSKPAKPPAPPPPAHLDFERLRAYRNYYAIASVGAYEHHFAVWFNCVEQSVSYYAVSPAGEVRRAGGMWGGLAVREGEPKPVPAEQEDNARKVLAHHAADYEHESSVRIEYRGSYREVEVVELVPTSGPGDPYARMVSHVTATLRANTDLSSASGIAEMRGGVTRLCWRDSTYRDCTKQDWIDFTPRDLGKAQLPALVTPGSPLTPDERARFLKTVLAAARRHAAGEPGVPLDDILAHQGDTLLPPGLILPFEVGFTLYARPREGSGAAQVQSSLTTKISVRDALGGVARGVARGTIAGIPVTAEIEMERGGTQPPPEHGAAELPFHVRYRLKDERGNMRSGEISMTAKLLVDGDAVIPTERTIPDSIVNRVHDAPMHQSLPGAGPFQQIDAYFGISTPSASPSFWP